MPDGRVQIAEAVDQAVGHGLLAAEYPAVGQLLGLFGIVISATIALSSTTFLGNAMAGELHYKTVLRLSYPEYAQELAQTRSFSGLDPENPQQGGVATALTVLQYQKMSRWRLGDFNAEPGTAARGLRCARPVSRSWGANPPSGCFTKKRLDGLRSLWVTPAACTATSASRAVVVPMMASAEAVPLATTSRMAACSSAAVDGVVAVTLGGSRATGDERADSDWDIGVYYEDRLDTEAIRAWGWAGQVFEPGDWGDVVKQDLDVSLQGAQRRCKRRGLRGIAFFAGEIYIAASDELFVYDQGFNIKRSFRSTYLKHCHEIFQLNNHLYLTWFDEQWKQSGVWQLTKEGNAWDFEFNQQGTSVEVHDLPRQAYCPDDSMAHSTVSNPESCPYKSGRFPAILVEG